MSKLPAMADSVPAPEAHAAAAPCTSSLAGADSTAPAHDYCAAIEQRYRTLLDAVPDAITVHDAAGKVVEANRTAAALYGYSEAELHGMDLATLNPDLAPDHMQRLMASLQPGQVEQVERRNRRQDGQRIPLEVRSALYADTDGMRVIAVARDLRRRRATEAELQATEQRLHALLAVIDKGVLIADGAGQLLSLNPAARRILDPAASGPVQDGHGELRWQDFELLDAHGQAVAVHDWPLARAVREGQPTQSQIHGVLHRPSGRLVWVSLTVHPVRDPDHPARIEQWIALFSDVTALKRLNELFAQAQTLTRTGGFEVDVPRGTVCCTDELCALLGCAVDAVPTLERWATRIHPADRDRVVGQVRHLRAERPNLEIEFRLHAADRQKFQWLQIMARCEWRDGRLLRVSGVVLDITARRQEEERLRLQAQLDSLTGLYNRDATFASLQRAIDQAEPGHGPALLFVDLDRFKVLNDLLGHAAGDRLLAACAARLRQSAPSSSVVGRIGADEFVVMLPEIGSDDLLWRVADRIGRDFSRPFQDHGEEFLVTASVGLARYPEDGGTPEQLLHHADAAMAEAKRRGRNGWQSFSPALAAQLKQRLLIETQLRRALEAGEFRLVYQPKVHLASGRIVGAEALLRWRNRSLGELPPDVFIPHAETTGDIVAIGAWVVREACGQLARWRRRGLKLDHVAVNISFRQFLSDRFERDIADALLDRGLDGSSLELELTERALIEDAPEVAATIDALRRLGVRLSIDDFGEGYSALGYLRRLPIQGLKLSHHFMQGIPASATDTRLCEVIVQMARALDLKVVAEGVETEAQRQFLLRQGAEMAQGYLFHRPLEVDAFAEVLRGSA